MCWHCACCGINVDPHWFQCGFGSGSSRSKFLRIHGDPDPQHWGTIIFYSYAIFLRYYDFQGIKFLRVTGQKSSASAGLRRPFSHGPSFTVFSASIQCVSNRGQWMRGSGFHAFYGSQRRIKLHRKVKRETWDGCTSAPVAWLFGLPGWLRNPPRKERRGGGGESGTCGTCSPGKLHEYPFWCSPGQNWRATEPTWPGCVMSMRRWVRHLLTARWGYMCKTSDMFYFNSVEVIEWWITTALYFLLSHVQLFETTPTLLCYSWFYTEDFESACTVHTVHYTFSPNGIQYWISTLNKIGII